MKQTAMTIAYPVGKNLFNQPLSVCLHILHSHHGEFRLWF